MVLWPWGYWRWRKALDPLFAKQLKRNQLLHMTRQRRPLQLILFGLGLFICIFSHLSLTYSKENEQVYLVQLEDDTINPVTAEYIIKAIDQAYQNDAQCFIIKLDTPGGLLNSTRLIVKHMLMARIPIVVYIAPGGSRAGSAGVFITYASHIATMAPSTNIGAAHPVQMGEAPGREADEWKELKKLLEELKKIRKEEKKEGSEETTTDKTEVKEGKEAQEIEAKEEKDEEEPGVDEDPMTSKILNDTVAFIKSIAKERNRNVEWAIKSVTKSDSITEGEALEKGVVEIIAKDDEDLLGQLDGRVVHIDDETEVTLATKGASIKRILMDPRQKFFNVLANPNIAYFLLILGFYGLLYEVTHPGFGLPGILGLIFLILAFYSMQTLPTNYAGLALLAVGLILLVAEVFVAGFGLLTFGGLACMILGSLLLFESVDPVMRVSISAIIAFSVATTVITTLLVTLAVRSYRRKVQGGQEGIIGEKGEAHTNIPLGQKGKVFIHGEIWNATSDKSIKKGETVEVIEVSGLMLKVKSLSPAHLPLGWDECEKI